MSKRAEKLILKRKDGHIERITKAEILRHVEYNRETGIFTIKNPRYHNTGPRPIVSNNHQYLYVTINKCSYKAHRVAWFLCYGTQPNIIDHINGIMDDNRICNLRSVDNRGNLQNNKINRCGHLVGTTFVPKRNKWRAQIKVKGKKIWLGEYSTAVKAHESYMKAVKAIYNNEEPEDARH